MRLLVLPALVFYLVSLSSCIVQTGGDPVEAGPAALPAREPNNETYNVYSAILDRNYNTGVFLIRDRTGTGLFSKSFQSQDEAGLTTETVIDYEEQNRSDAPLRMAFAGGAVYVLFGDREDKKLFGRNENVTGRFRQNHPKAKGIITFSKIGFNKEINQALLSVDYWCGGQCGGGTFYFLVKSDDKWVIQWQKGISVS